MRKIKLFASRGRVRFAAAMLALTGAHPAKAAVDPSQLLNEGTQQLQKSVGAVLTIVMIICAVSGAISVAWALIDRKNAQEGANQRLMNTGIGLVVAFLIIGVLRFVLTKLGATT